MLNIDAIEAIELSDYHNTIEAYHFLRDVCRIYRCYPKNGDEYNFFEFLNTIFHAGRIEGVRQERARRNRA